MKKLDVISKKLENCIIKFWLQENIYYDWYIDFCNVKTSLEDLITAVIYMLDSLDVSETEKVKSILIDLSSLTEKDMDKSKQIIFDAMIKISGEEQYLNDQLKVTFLKNEIKQLMLEIKKCNNFTESERYFLFLERIQTILSILVFMHGVNNMDGLYAFVRDFDRIDDEDTRRDIYNKIKHGEYLNEAFL